MTGPHIFTPDYYTRMHDLEAASWWNSGMRAVAARLLAPVLPAKGTLVDVGCGSGQTMAWFRAAWPGWRTLGVDVAPEGLAAARSAGESVLEGSALELPIADACADAVITLDVLQHLPLGGGDVQALAEIRRVLRPGGHLFIRTNAQAWPRIDDDARHDFHKYGAAELRAKLAAAGFVVHRVGRLNAVLGLAEIPRELRARRAVGPGYVGLLADVPSRGIAWRAKRAWLQLEGALLGAGFSWPLGRTLIALAQSPEGKP